MANLRVTFGNVDRLNVQLLGKRAPLRLCGRLLCQLDSSVACNVEHCPFDKVRDQAWVGACNVNYARMHVCMHL